MDVSCPTCHGHLTVPATDEMPANGGPGSPAPVFERSDFEDYLRSPFSDEAARHAAASRGRGVRPLAAVPVMIDVERLPDEAVPGAPPVAGILLTPARLSIALVIVILLLAVAFAAGIAVDRLFLIRPN